MRPGDWVSPRGNGRAVPVWGLGPLHGFCVFECRPAGVGHDGLGGVTEGGGVPWRNGPLAQWSPGDRAPPPGVLFRRVPSGSLCLSASAPPRPAALPPVHKGSVRLRPADIDPRGHAATEHPHRLAPKTSRIRAAPGSARPRTICVHESSLGGPQACAAVVRAEEEEG